MRASGASLRTVMARFPTGVTVVSARNAAGEPFGLTVNSFTSVSLDPPTVLICIGHGSTSHDPLLEAKGFVVNVLSAAQAELAKRFATRPSEGRFEGVRWKPAPSGHPIVEDAAAWLDCVIDQIITAGDHSIILAHTTALEAGDVPALVFHGGEMGSTDR